MRRRRPDYGVIVAWRAVFWLLVFLVVLVVALGSR